MTRRPLIHAPIFQTIPPPPPFKVNEQRFYVVFGNELSRLNVKHQRLYMINDFSSVTAYRYWRVWGFQAIFAAYGNIEFREAAGVPQAATGGTPVPYDNWETNPTNLAKGFDGDLATYTREFGLQAGVGYDFGAGGEIAAVQVAISDSTGIIHNPFTTFYIEASNDNITWTLMKSVVNDPEWSSGETRLYNL